MTDDRGLYDKFDVTRTDGRDGLGDKHYCCDYFVLDLTHDPHARSALVVYALLCREDRPHLSREIIEKYLGRR